MNLVFAGTPNSGKTSVFNRLTGLNQHVGNYPGVTVDKKTGSFKLDGQRVNVLDLPGTYGLYPASEDERVLLDVLLDHGHENYPKGVIYIANASNLDRSLPLLTQIADLGFPVICCLNMLDVAEDEGISIDDKKLEKELSFPVVRVNGKTGAGIEDLKAQIRKFPKARTKLFYRGDKVPAELLAEAKRTLGTENDYQAHLHLFHFESLRHCTSLQREQLRSAIASFEYLPTKVEMADKMNRILDVDQVVQRAVHQSVVSDSPSLTDRIDRILTHRIWGTTIFLGLLFLIFQLVFSVAEYPMNWIDSGISGINEFLRERLPESWFIDLLTDGIITGIGGIVIFIPQIALLFGIVSLLEESGYMTRAVFLADRLMHRVGLNGRSLVALISGVACAVPAIMSARTISNSKERLITIFVTPFISCSARLPVFIVLTALVVPNEYYLGFINLQGLVILALYLLGVLAAIGSSWALKRILKTRELSFLMLELPPYQWPQWKNTGITIVEKVKVFVVNAGKIILVISIILWALASYGPGDKMDVVERETMEAHGGDMNDDELNNLIAARQLEVSYAGHLGKMIEPVIQPIGLDWKMGIALITSFAAREVFVGTMATIYSAGSDDEQTIIERMRNERSLVTGKKVYTPATSFSLLIFYVFAMQCMSTMAIVKHETKSWAIPIYQFLYMTGLAYLGSWIIYRLLL